jgi:hypothetical protein
MHFKSKELEALKPSLTFFAKHLLYSEQHSFIARRPKLFLNSLSNASYSILKIEYANWHRKK